MSYIGPNLYHSGYLGAHLVSYLIKESDEILIVNISREIDNQHHLLKKEEGFRAYYQENNKTGNIIKLDIKDTDIKSIERDLSKAFNDHSSIKVVFVTNSRVSKVAQFIENNCYNVDVSVLPKFNIYMYDGNHTNQSHYNALLHYYNCLDDIFIFIVDDWNWKDVRDGTVDSIQKLNLKVMYEKEIRLTWDNSVTPEPELSKNWWNGIYVAILQK